MLMVYWTAVIIYLVSRKMQDRESKKISLYPEFPKKRTNLLLRSGEKIKNKELVPWYSQSLDTRVSELREMKKMYENALISEEKNFYRENLKQCAEETLEWCKRLKKEYRFVLLRKDRKHLDAQIKLANSIL